MKNKKNLLYIFIAIVVLGGLIYLVRRPTKISVEAATAKIGVFEDIIKSDGRFRAKERYTLSAYASGNLSRVDLKIGDRVAKGKLLAVLDWDYKMNIKSPIDGVVSKVYRESAGPIVRGEPVIEVVNPKNLEIVIELLTTDAVRVRKGNFVRVDNWGGENQLEAQVIKKSAAGFTKISALGVEEERTEITAELIKAAPDETAHIGDNFHVDLSIVISQEKDVLKIPIGALFKFEDRWAVYTVVNNKARLTLIDIQDKNYEEVWVKAGLKEGETVILYPGDLIKDGSVIFIAKHIN